MKLLTVANAKTVKGEKLGWRTGILYLAPHTVSGHAVCPYSTQGCREICLYTAGRGRFSNVQTARVRKTRWLFEDRQAFIAQLLADIQSFAAQCARAGLRPCIRLNGTSDIPWWHAAFGEIPQHAPDVTFYGYTKQAAQATGDVTTPDNWHSVFSYTGNTGNRRACRAALARGMNVAVIFRGRIPTGRRFLDHEIIDGDAHDLRFIEPHPRIVGLKAKGAARRAQDNPMVVNPDGPHVTD